MSTSSMKDLTSYSEKRIPFSGPSVFLQNNFVSPYSNQLYMRINSELPKQKIKVKSKV